MTEKTSMNDFANNYMYIQIWMDTNKVRLTEMKITSKVDKDDPNSNVIVWNGIECRVWINGRPTNRKALQFLCCADSAKDGYPISANQAKVNIMKWIEVNTRQFYDENIGQPVHTELFLLPAVKVVSS